MKITGMSFENYKAFRRPESVKIRPLTILIGRNNSGKSAIARLPLLTGDVDYWPKNIFSEDFEEVKAIRKAQKG